MKKYRYEYVNVVFEGLRVAKLNEHREIIDRRAADGWRYVGYIPTYETFYGQTNGIDLIFETEAEE